MDGVLALLSPALFRRVAESDDARDAAREVWRALRTAPEFVRAVDELVDPGGPGGKCAATARRLKREADAALVVGAYDISVRTYNDALRAAPDIPNVVAPLRSNRAAALLRLAAAAPPSSRARHHLLRLALGDCDAALTADPSLVRARVRRTVARRALGRVRDAIDDARRVVEHLADRDAPEATRDVARRRLETLLEDDSAASEGERGGRPRRRNDRGDDPARGDAPAAADDDASPSASSASEVLSFHSFTPRAEPRPTAHAGVGVFATRSLRPGDAACVEPAHVAMLRRERSRVACHRCFARAPVAVVPCRGCRLAAYCSETCRDDDADDPGAHAGECGGGCWAAVLPQQIVLARRAVARANANAKENANANANASSTKIRDHRDEVRRLVPRSVFDLAGGDATWRDMGASDRAALATACAVASSCVVAGETVDAGDVAAATSAIRTNAFTVRTRPSNPASGAHPDPEKYADDAWNALARDLNPRPSSTTKTFSRRRFLDAWRDMSAEDDVVATALFLSTSRFNHACDPNAHVALEVIPARTRDETSTEPSKNRGIFTSRTRRGGVSSHRVPVRAVTRVSRPVAAGEALSVSYGPAVGDAPTSERRERLAASHGFVCACVSCVDTFSDARRANAYAVDARLAAAVDDARAALHRVAGSNPTGEREKPGVSFFHSALREPREALARAIDACRRPSRGFPPLARSLGEAEDCAARLLVASGDVEGAANRAKKALASVEAAYPRDALAPAMERARVAALIAAAGGDAKEAKALADAAGTTLRAHVGSDDARGSDATPCAARRAARLVEAISASLASRIGTDAANGEDGEDEREREEGEGLYELD